MANPPKHLIYREQFTIRTYEIDNRKVATIPALVKLMHEAAMQNVIRLKLSVWDLEPHQISWVLMRKLLTINRLPILGEKITIETTPTGFEKFFTFRDYKVFDEQGELIAFSSSTWLLMDTQSRRMTRIPDFIMEFQQWMPAPEVCLPRPTSKLPKFEPMGEGKQYLVRWHDLDFNMHLNNTFYVQWMIESVPEKLIQKGQLKQMDIIYRTECSWKEKVMAELQVLDENSYLHRLVRQSDQKEVALAKTTWMNM